MKIKIRNFRGCSEADIDATAVTLIAGRNHSGKTSIMQAIAAGMTGNAIPIPGLAKANAGLLVRSGSGGGEVCIDTGAGVSTVSYPAAKRESTGEPATISDDAAGLHSFLDDSATARSQTVSELLGALPTRERLAEELMKLGAGEKGIERVWETITKQGWDNAHQVAKETGVRLKGQWDNETGSKYGSKKAEQWVPADWTEDLAIADEETLTAAVKHEQEWLEAAISNRAVGDAEIARLKTLADSVPELIAKSEEQTILIGALRKSQSEISTRMQQLPPAARPETVSCPHCSKPIQIVGGRVIVPTVISDEELTQRRKVIDECKKSLDDVSAEITKASADIMATSASIAAGKKAAEELSKSKPGDTADSAGVDSVRAKLELAQKRLLAYQKRTKAESIHKQIVRNQEIIDILAPDGLRLTCLKTALGTLNTALKSLSESAGWRAPELRQDMSVTYGGSMYLTLSDSEQYRVRVLMQLAFAGLQKSGTVLIDRADILDSAGRNGLVKLLHGSGLNAVVAMTVNAVDKCPNLSKIGGSVYWVENGVAQCI